MEGVIFDLRHVSYCYEGGISGLTDVTVPIAAGDAVALLGPNGSGKTTLLKILDGLYYPTAGEFYAFGELISERRLADRSFNKLFRTNVGLTFQDVDAQLFSPTVADELAFGPRQLGLDAEEIRARVNKTADILGITALLNRYPYSLSGGEKRKVAIGSVFAIDPAVYLLDEPTANLDPKTADRLIDLIISLREDGKTLVVATQDLDFAGYVAEKFLVLGQDKRLAVFADKGTVAADTALLDEIGLIRRSPWRAAQERSRCASAKVEGEKGSVRNGPAVPLLP